MRKDKSNGKTIDELKEDLDSMMAFEQYEQELENAKSSLKSFDDVNKDLVKNKPADNNGDWKAKFEKAVLQAKKCTCDSDTSVNCDKVCERVVADLEEENHHLEHKKELSLNKR